MQYIVRALVSIQDLALKPKQDIDTCMRADGLPLVKDKMITHNIS